jgi:hypothetical protein
MSFVRSVVIGLALSSIGQNKMKLILTTITILISACGTTQYVVEPPKALTFPTEECEPLMGLLGDGDIDELELLMAIKGWFDQYDDCAGRHHVLIEGIKEWNRSISK